MDIANDQPGCGYDTPLVLSSDQWQWMLSYSVVPFNIATYVYKSLEVVPTNNSLPKVFTPTKKLLLSLDEEPINLEYILMTILICN